MCLWQCPSISFLYRKNFLGLSIHCLVNLCYIFIRKLLDGIFQRNCKVRISREGEQIFEGELASLKRFKDDVKEVKAGYECGLVFDGFNDVKEEDKVEAYIMVEVPR